MRSALPDCITAATESPPPTMVSAPLCTSASHHRHRAVAERRDLEDAHRPVPEDRLRLRDLGGKARARSPGRCRRRAVRRESPAPTVCTGSIALRRARDTMVDRQQQLHAALACLIEEVLGGVDPIRFDQRVADCNPLRLQEGVRHRAADEQRVDFAEQVVDDRDLVRHLGAAEDRPPAAAPAPARPCRDTRTPSAAGSRRHVASTYGTMPAVEACARCAVPNASLI